MAFSILHKRNPASRLILRGDGKLEEKIRKIINLLGISGNVIFIKELHNLEHLYSAFDVFWLPSFFEGLPMSGVEAQCSGLPCIFSDTITGEIALTEHAVQLPISNPFRWADETLSLFHRFVRTDKSAKVASAGFDIKIQSLKLKEYYESLLQNGDTH
jgi:glycosyltransferase EpsF